MNKLVALYQKASVREKVLMVGTGLSVVAFALVSLLWDPLWRSSGANRQQLADMESDIQALQVEEGALRSVLDKDVNEVMRQENEVLAGQLAERQKILSARMARFVPQEEMLGLLRAVLERNRGLQLVDLSKLPAEQLSTPVNGEKSDPEVALFNHQVRLTFAGNYFETLGFIDDVEHQLPRLRWESMDYQVSHYPEANVTLVFATLGVDARWLGM